MDGGSYKLPPSACADCKTLMIPFVQVAHEKRAAGTKPVPLEGPTLQRRGRPEPSTSLKNDLNKSKNHEQ